MKRISLLLTCLTLLCGLIEAQNEKISFNKTSHDFGTIGERSGLATFDFVVTNNSNEPILITLVSTGCGCTTPVWTKEPIEPQKTGTIKVSYDPLGRPYGFNRPITVYFDKLPPANLTIIGNVVKEGNVNSSVPPERGYPIAIGNYLFKIKEFLFGQIDLNETSTVTMEIYNNSDKPVSPKPVRLPKYLTVDVDPPVIPAKSAASINVTLNTQDNSLYGKLSGEITFTFNEMRQSFPYAAVILDDFSKWTASKKAEAGRIGVNATEIDFGNFKSGNSKTIKISNSGKSVLNVRNIQSTDPSITVSKNRFSINPNEIAEIKVNADNKKIQSSLSSVLAIITDDPNRPIYEVSVLASKN